MSDIHSEMPKRNVLIPSVTTLVLTPTFTTRKAFTTPIATAASTATTAAGHTPHPWFTTSTGRIVAENPNTAGTDRSTNSPTQMVHSSAMVMNTRGCWEPKIVWNVVTCQNRPWSMPTYTAIIAAQTATIAYRAAKCRVPETGRLTASAPGSCAGSGAVISRSSCR